MKNKKKWKSSIKNEWKKPLIAISSTATIGSISLISLGFASSLNKENKVNKDKIEDSNQPVNNQDDNPLQPIDPNQKGENGANPNQEGEGGGGSGGDPSGGGSTGGDSGGGGSDRDESDSGASSGGSSGGSSGDSGGSGSGGTNPNPGEGGFSTRPNPFDTLQSRFNTWKDQKGEKVKSLYKQHYSYSTNLQAFNDQEKEKWIQDKKSKPYLDNWKTKIKEQVLKPKFTSSNDYSLKLQDYLSKETILSKDQWLQSDFVDSDYQDWINNHKFDLKNIWHTTSDYTNSQGQNKARWLNNNPTINTKHKFLNTNNADSFYEKWITSNDSQIKGKWQNTPNYQSYYNSTKALLLNDPSIATKNKFAAHDESNLFYNNWIFQNYQSFKDDWKNSDDYNTSFKKYKSYWKKANKNLNTVAKYIASNQSGININSWKNNNFSKIKKYWMTTDDFKNLFNLFKLKWKGNNPLHNTKTKFANSGLINSYYNAWKNTKPVELINEFKKNNIYTLNFNGFKKSFKNAHPHLDTKDKFINNDSSKIYYDQWRLQRNQDLSTLWKNTNDYTLSLKRYKNKWKKANPSLDTKEKFALSSNSDINYNNWILQREDALKQKWLKSADSQLSFTNFKTLWQGQNTALDTKEKFASNDLSNSYYNKWITTNHDALKREWLKSDTKDNLFAAYKTEFIKQNPNKNTVGKWIDNNFYNKLKYSSWQKSQIDDILAAWKQDGNKFATAFNNYQKLWKQNNPILDNKEKFSNHPFAIPLFIKYKTAHNLSSLGFWKTTADYKAALNNYVNQYIEKNGSKVLATKTKDDQYQKWASTNDKSQIDNWVKLSPTKNPGFIRYKEVWKAHNNKDTYLKNNFPLARYEEWKKTNNSLFNEWKKELSFQTSFQSWVNKLPAADQVLATSKFLGKSKQRQDFYLKYLNANFTFDKDYVAAKYTKFKTWIENDPGSFLYRFKSNFVNQYPQYRNVEEFFKTQQSHNVWKEWFQGEITKDQSLKSNLLAKWENNELRGVDGYESTLSQYKKDSYTLNDFIRKVKTNSTWENTFYNDYKTLKINNLKKQNNFSTKQKWIDNISSNQREWFFDQWVETKPKPLMDKYFASPDYEKDYKHWESNLTNNNTHRTYSTIEKWSQNHLPENERVETNRSKIINKNYTTQDLKDFQAFIFNGSGLPEGQYEKGTKEFFWNFDTYIASEPLEFRWYLYTIIREQQYIPKVSQFVFETQGWPKLTINVPRNQRMYTKNILEHWLRKRLANVSDSGSLLSNGKDNIDMKFNYTFQQLNLNNLPDIIKRIFNPDDELFHLREEFIKVLKIMIPNIETYNVDIPTVHNYIRGGMDAVRNASDSDPVTKEWGFSYWYKTFIRGKIKLNFSPENKLFPVSDIRFKRNLIIKNLKKASLSVLGPKYTKFKKDKFKSIINSQAFTSEKNFAKYITNSPQSLISQEYKKVSQSTNDYQAYLVYKAIMDTFRALPSGYSYQSSANELDEAFMIAYTSNINIRNAQYAKAAKIKIKTDPVFNVAFEKYLYNFANRGEIDKIYSIILNNPTLAETTYKNFLIDRYYKNVDVPGDFKEWRETNYIWTNDFETEYNQTLTAQLQFKDNLIKEYSKSAKVQQDYENWKAGILNMRQLYMQTDDASQFYENEPLRIYFDSVVNKEVNFTENIKTRAIGQPFYELSGQARVDLTDNLEPEFDGSPEQFVEFLEFLDSQNNVFDLYQKSDQLEEDYNQHLENEFKKSDAFKLAINQWMNEGNNGINIYKNSSMANDHYNEYIMENFISDDSIVQKFVQTWAATKANGLNAYKNASHLEDDYNDYLKSIFKNDASFNSQLDQWSSVKNNGLSIYQTTDTLQKNYDNFLLNQFFLDKNGFNYWLDNWTSNKANALSLYKTQPQSSADYQTFIEEEFHKSLTFKVEYDIWSKIKANGINAYINSDQLEIDYEKHLLTAFENDNMDSEFNSWSNDSNNIWDSYSKGENAENLYDTYIRTQFENDSTKQNEYLLAWSLDKNNGLNHYLNSPQLDLDYSKYLDDEIANHPNKQNHFMLWAKNTQAIIDQYANDNTSTQDYQKFINEQYAQSNQQENQDFNLWINGLLHNKSRGIDYYKAADNSSLKYDQWKLTKKRTEYKYQLNHIGQFNFDFNDWLEDKSNVINLYRTDSMSSIDYQTWAKTNPGSLQAYIDSLLYDNHLDYFVKNVLTWNKYGTLFTKEKWWE